MSFLKNYSLIIGLVLLAIVIVILITPPDMIFSSGISVVDTELSESQGPKNFVRTNMDFGNAARVEDFPTVVEGWEGKDWPTSDVEELLKPETIMLRGYTKAGEPRVVWFLIMQSKNLTSFHEPPVCYVDQGWKVEEEGKEEIPTAQIEWPDSVSADASLATPLPVKKLVVSKTENGSISSRRLVLYFYIKRNTMNPFSESSVTMIRADATIPTQGTYSDVLITLQNFTADAIPNLFEPAHDYKENQMIAQKILNAGILGYIAILVILSIPGAFIVYPLLKRTKDTDGNIFPQDDDDLTDSTLL